MSLDVSATPACSPGFSKAEKDAASARLDEKIKKLAAEAGETPNKDVFAKFFDGKEKNTLLQRLAVARGSKPATLQETWNGLMKMGQIMQGEALRHADGLLV